MIKEDIQRDIYTWLMSDLVNLQRKFAKENKLDCAESKIEFDAIFDLIQRYKEQFKIEDLSL